MNTIQELTAPRVIKARTGKRALTVDVSPLSRRPRDYINGDRVRSARRMRRMTQAQLADAAELSVAQVSRMETVSPRLKLYTLVRIAKALGVSPKYLTGETDREQLWDEQTRI